MGKKDKPEEIVTTEPVPVDYIVEVQGVIQLVVQKCTDSKEYVKGLAVGQITSQIPSFKVLKTTVHEKQ